MIQHRCTTIAILAVLWLALWEAPACSADDAGLPGRSGRTLSSASELDYPPFALVRDDGTADGFSVDLLRAVCRAVGMEVSFRVAPWHVIKDQLVNGEIDVLPFVSYSAERDRTLDFTTPYLRLHGTIFVRRGETSIRGEADLKDREVLVMRGDTAHEYAEKRQLTDRLILTDSFEEAMRRLSGGEHDAVIIQHLAGLQLLKKLGITNVVSVRPFDEPSLKLDADPLSGFEQKFCIAVKEGDKELLARLNEGLALVITEGLYDALYEKWFGPILPHPSVSPAAIAKYLAYILLPLFALVGVSYAWLLRREVARKTSLIKENEDRLERAQEIAHLGSWELDLINNRLTWSDEVYRIFGLQPRQFTATYEAFLECVHPDDRQKVDAAYSGSLREDQDRYEIEHRVVRPDGSIRLVHERCEHRRDASGRIVRSVGMVHDITARQKAEAELHSLSQFPEENPNPVMRVTPDGTLMYRNAAAQDLLTVSDRTRGNPLPDLLHEAVAQARKQNQAVEREISLPDGRTFGFFAIQPRNEDYVNLYGMEITDRKRAEEGLKASLAEKEVLLKEIHHRVKNNMQVISSLVDLQADEVADAGMRGIFQEVVHRVHSMAMVHEKLYQSQDLARVEFADYTRTLLGYLWRAQGAAQSGIRYDLDLSPVFLSVNQAVPCGLMLNELFSNALKHAFAGRDGGRVSVSLEEDPDGWVRLAVRDDGIGLPAGLDWRKTPSLGLRLVQMLARQLKADVAAGGEAGTAFTIRFQGVQP